MMWAVFFSPKRSFFPDFFLKDQTRISLDILVFLQGNPRVRPECRQHVLERRSPEKRTINAANFLGYGGMIKLEEIQTAGCHASCEKTSYRA